MQQDQFGRLLPTFIQVINLTEQEETEYWAVVSAVFDGRQVDSVTSRPSFVSINSTSLETSINNKVCLQSPYHPESQLSLLLSEYLLKFSNFICFMLAHDSANASVLRIYQTPPPPKCMLSPLRIPQLDRQI
jgi:hypothetical protein